MEIFLSNKNIKLILLVIGLMGVGGFFSEQAQARKVLNWSHEDLGTLQLGSFQVVDSECGEQESCGCGPNGTQDPTEWNAAQEAYCHGYNGGIPVYSEYDCSANNQCAGTNRCAYRYTCQFGESQ